VTPLTLPSLDAHPTLLAREPILDRSGRVVGHELLFRDGGSGPSERATARLLVAGTGDHELSQLTGGLPAWIKVSREFLLAFDPLPLAPGSVVLELEASPMVDDALLKRLRLLRGEGHAVALDDFLPRAELEPLLPFASYVKVDVAAYGLGGLRAVLDRLPEARPKIVATNVEMPSQAEACERRGVELLQGFFFERPRETNVKPIPIASIDRLRAVIALRGRPDFEEVEAVVAEDPGLTVRLLRFANSASIGARRRFSSVREAMVLLGSERVRQLMLLVLLSDLGEGRPALLSASVLRGRLCETIARETGAADPDTAFTAGVLSTVDALLDQRLFDVLKSLPITEELRWALLGRAGTVGAILDTAIRIERNRAGDDATAFSALGESVRWSDQALEDLIA
jgi:EAL and modified HD-GYP domain-containing signal transduction protein